MCDIVVINRGEKEIETPRQFEEHFGFLPDKDIHYNSIEMDYCFCQYDIEETFKAKNIPFKKYYSDFYVGQLDEVVGDDD